MCKFYAIFHVVYAGMKYMFGLNKTKPGKPIRYLLVALTVLILVTLVSVILPLYLFFSLVDVYLRLRHGKRYIGMLKGQDFLTETTEKLAGHNWMFIVKRNGTYEEYEETIRRCFEKLHLSCSKLRYEIENTLGYKYYLKNSTKFENFVTVVEDITLTKDNVAEYITHRFMDISFLENKAWHLFIFKEPIEWSRNCVIPEQIIILSFRHSVGDGVALISLMSKVFDGFELVPFASNLSTNRVKENNDLLLDDLHVHEKPFKNKSFQRNDLSNYFTFFAEDDVKYAPMIKRIKRKLHVGFTDVLTGCLVSALVAYSKKQGKIINGLKLASTIQSIDKQTIDLLQGAYDNNKISNTSKLLLINISPNLETEILTELVQKCYAEKLEMQTSAEFILGNMASKIAHLLTSPVDRYIGQHLMRNIDLMVSNVSGFKSAIIGDKVAENILVFQSDCCDYGFMMAILSLKDRLQISFVGAQSILNGRQDLDDILADMFKNIEILYENHFFVSNGVN